MATVVLHQPAGQQVVHHLSAPKLTLLTQGHKPATLFCAQCPLIVSSLPETTLLSLAAVMISSLPEKDFVFFGSCYHSVITGAAQQSCQKD